MGMAEDHGAPGAHVVDVLAPVLIDEPCPAPGTEKYRRAADRTKRAHGRIYAARNALQGAFKEGAAAFVHRGLAQNRRRKGARTLAPPLAHQAPRRVPR